MPWTIGESEHRVSDNAAVTRRFGAAKLPGGLQNEAENHKGEPLLDDNVCPRLQHFPSEQKQGKVLPSVFPTALSLCRGMASAIPPLPTGGALKNPKGGKLAQLKQAMTQAQPDTQKNASSVKAMEAYLAATQGMSAKQKKAYVLKRRADEARIQQLRGIFAAYDEDKDGVLSEE